MEWLWRPVNAYCERTDASVWSEPLNAISNLSFFIAAILLCRLALRATGTHRRLGLIFGALLGLIGVGSTLFHTFANELNRLLDVLFIYVFTLGFLMTFLVRVMRRTALEAAGWVGVFISAVIIATRLGGGPTCGYAITLLGLLALALAALHRRSPVWAPMLWASGLLALSLTARELDLRLCEWNPRGTHFLWHLINGPMLYVVGSTLVRAPMRSEHEAALPDASAPTGNQE